ncbi:MAG: prepilin-type N-terminal cleavage/methylation domain-containing protein [Rhodospirillales bacterium]
MTRPDEGVRHGGDGGFTLLELLVAITVFALMAGILVAGFRFGVRVWEQAETASMQLTDVESAYAIVRRLIANAQPLTVASEDGNVHVDFAGTASRLSFVAPSPVQAFVGALHTISLVRVPAGPAKQGEQLVLNVRPYEPDEANETPRRRAPGKERLDKSVVLVDRAQAVEFLYFGGDDADPTPKWQTTWINREAPPKLVAVRIRFAADDRRRWPDLIVAPVVLEAAY